ncbi:MAG: NPCBM/NEW2 domain-containing protein, partial [Alphaproteobacteria bacterium]|nr:NPCBM/NEW2 domain-containing protein [Alphaproteobacteria bacterium]
RERPRGDFVLSLCNWGSANVRAWGQDVGTTWRTSNDIDPSWGRLLHNFDSVATRELYAGPGHWNDPDMLEVGNGLFDAAHLIEARAQMSLWAIAAAPLIIGTDLTRAPHAILDVLGAPEVIAVDQDPAGNQGVIAYADSEREIIVKALGQRGAKAVVLFNRLAEPTDITLTAAHLKLAGPIALRDLWQRRDIGTFSGRKAFHLGAHEALMLRATGAPLLAQGSYLSEMTGRIHVAADGIRVPEPDPIIYRMVDPYVGDTSSGGHRPAYAGWGGPRADATPYDQGLSVAGEGFRYGLGVLANSRLEVKADGKFRHFTARVGVDDSTRSRNSAVRFEIYGDGRLLAASQWLSFGDPAKEIAADTAEVRVVELIVQAAKPADSPIVASWGNARFN